MTLRLDTREDYNEIWLMHETARGLCTCFDRRSGPLGLSRAQWRLLSILRHHPGIRQTQLAERLEIKAITLGRLLDRMEKRKWIKRVSDPSDRRAKCIYPDKKAEGILKKMRSLSLLLREEALTGFSAREHTALIGYLRRVKTNVAHQLNDKKRDKHA
jgi:DNA-binding MarR family transcriptional regulator